MTLTTQTTMRLSMCRSDRKKYTSHKSSAKFRGIDFKLTFEEWFDIWQKSGHYHERGRGVGSYVMSRIQDKGAYEVGNVFIQSNSDNVKQAMHTGPKNLRHSTETKILFSKQRKGHTKSSEWRDKIRLSNLGKKKPQQIIQCPHCKKEGAANNMKRWHFENCKDKV
jgi:hypothetical protein